MKHEECTVCQYAKEGVEIPKLDHTHNMIHHDAVPATCTNDGTVEYWHCTKCSKDYSGCHLHGKGPETSYLPALPGHGGGSP